MDVVLGLFLVTIAAALGGTLSKLIRAPSLVGYIIVGIIAGVVLPDNLKSVSVLSQIGTILLLFSIGVELSLDKLSRFLNVAVFGGLIQMILTTMILISVFILFKIPFNTSLILALGFSLSSTAVCVKMLSDRGEIDTIHGGVMVSWLLVQDLAVIPIMVLLPIIGNSGASFLATLTYSLFKASLVVIGTLVLGKFVVPKIIHFVAEFNSRELLLLTAVAIALGTAATTSFFGISAALGAFLAGIVISESQEHHAVFAETRPLRDMFVALFFVTLGFMVNPGVVLNKLPLIIAMALVVVIVKIIVVFLISTIFDYKGRSAVANSLGLSQVGEFAFVIFSSALVLGIITPENTSIGISVTLLTLAFSPLLFNSSLSVWRWLKKKTSGSFLANVFAVGEGHGEMSQNLNNHIIICGYGRVGRWVGKALSSFEIPFVVVDYNQKVVQDLREEGLSVLYGDPTEPEVMEAVFVRDSKAVVIAIPDRIAQETLITYIQTVAPSVKIISRVHLDSDWEKLKTLQVNKLVQPEFEAAMEIVKSILRGIGKDKEEISKSIKTLRVFHSK